MHAENVILGAGPAGLTAGWELDRAGRRCLVLEADPEYVGGLSRTVVYKGNRFDIGGHRFYSKSAEVNRLWQEMLPGEWLHVPRLSRIYYGRRFFPYPLRMLPTLANLGPVRSLRILFSYLAARLWPRRPEVSFADWIVNRFGHELYATFFKTYTEKVWGLPCEEISRDFAAQRIRGLSFVEAVRRALLPNHGSGAKTLIDRFLYPRLGPGQLWEAVRDRLVARGHGVHLGREVVRVERAEGAQRSAGSAGRAPLGCQGSRVTAVWTRDGARWTGENFYSTLTLRDLVAALDPPAPEAVQQAARALRYRDFLTVALLVDRRGLFEDNWVYVHDPGVRVGRVQNYGNWSAAMVADPRHSCLGLEYFCNRGDDLWEREDADLVRLGVREMEQIGLLRGGRCLDGCVVRLRDAYPVYDGDYQRNRETVKAFLNGFVNLFPAGRGGLHNYNSQDHSMMAAVLSVRSVLDGVRHDVWALNTEMEYAEEGEASAKLESRLVPRRVG